MLQMLGKPIFAVLDLVLDAADWIASNCVQIKWEGLSDHSRPLDSEPEETLLSLFD